MRKGTNKNERKKEFVLRAALYIKIRTRSLYHIKVAPVQLGFKITKTLPFLYLFRYRKYTNYVSIRYRIDKLPLCSKGRLKNKSI